MRIENYLIYCLNCYKVCSVKQFRNLIVTDRLHDILGAETRSFVTQNETPSKIVLPLEITESAESFEGKRRLANLGKITGDGKRKSLPEARRASVGENKATEKKNRGCFLCNSTEHFARNCPTMRVTRANLVQKENLDNDSVVGVEMLAQENVVRAPIFHSIETIDLACGRSQFEGSIDSGAEMSAIRNSVLPGHQRIGKNLKLTGAFGEYAVDELAYVPLRLLGKPR